MLWTCAESMSFQDHFSDRAGGYAAYRPRYPEALFAWLAGACRSREVAWDCATGNGQAACGLAGHFGRVIATDASAAQIENATPGPGVEYRVAPAEACGLPDRSVDLVTVAQALHWVDRPRFYREAHRVGRPGALLACWMYHLVRSGPTVDPIIDRFYQDVVGPYWPGERALIDQQYATIEFPAPELEAPRITMTANWTLPQLIGFLGTWSAVSRYLAARGHDPVALIVADLEGAWGNPSELRELRWPVSLRVARLN